MSKDESKVFYRVRKRTRLATIAEAHETIEGLRNVVVPPPNVGGSSNHDSDTEEVLAESIEKIYQPAGEVVIEEYLESDHKAFANTYQKKTKRTAWMEKSLWV